MREQLPARLRFGQGGIGIVADRREALINVVVEGNPEIVGREVLLAHEARTFSGFPMMLGDHLLGVLAVSGREGQPLDAADEVVLRALVGQAAVAIQNARLYEDARTHEIEARRALEELRRTQEQLVRMEKLRALGEMASGVAHDFNNVLAVILGRVQLLQRKLEDPTCRRWLAIVEQAALDGAQTVRQIQEFTRVRRDQPTQTVEVNQAIRDAVEMTRARWQDESQSRGVPIRLTLDLTVVPTVDGQPSELREVLTNLILNAVDALPRGGDIRIATRERAGRVEVIVADTGVGMSESVRRRIFEPFFSTKGPGGTGLGLAMVYGIVSRHGGEILVDTAEGTGSTFTIRLPVGRTAPEPAPRIPVTGTESVRVLVIDDEPFVRDTLGEILRQQHHQVVVADDGASGLARFRETAVRPGDDRSGDARHVRLAGGPGREGGPAPGAGRARDRLGRRGPTQRDADARRRPRDDQTLPVRGCAGSGRELPGSRGNRIGEGGAMTSPVIVEAIRTLVERRDLTRLEAAAAMEALMSGAATSVQVAAFLTALRMKGETVEELIGLAEVMRLKAVRVRTRTDVGTALAGTDREMLIDTAGTGGDASGTFNVSTATAFVVAGAGLKVAKHGNRSVSSLCGSADVVETLGVSLDLSPAKVAQCIDQVGIGFLYAPLLHTAMKHVMPARREMGIRTAFNILGPLTNPAGANAQVIGVYSRALVEPLARVLAELGTIRAFVVHGADGLDEISTTGDSWAAEVREGVVRTNTDPPGGLRGAARDDRATSGAGTGRRTRTSSGASSPASRARGATSSW